MAAIGNPMPVGYSPRERALGAATQASAQGQVQRGGGCGGGGGGGGGGRPNVSTLAGLRRVAQAFEGGYGPPQNLPANLLVSMALNPGSDRSFFRALPRLVAYHGHPLRALQPRTATFVMHFLDDLLLPTVNPPRAPVFAVRRDVRFDINQPADQRSPHIGITGHPPIVITRNGVLHCVIVVNRYRANIRHFNEGRLQALLYAAALGFEARRGVLAIVTDVGRWQLFRVNAGQYEQSPVIRVACNDRLRGQPVPQQLRDVLGAVGNFLING